MSGPITNPTREQRAVSSSQWAAAGDALGWITELGREKTVEARTGRSYVERPVDWDRRIGGRGGVRVPLPAGTYSDDTQLRLAVCRSIRGDGVFDAEAFARVEMTTWQGYLLGAGLGSKAAAANLSKRGVNWFSNFFETERQSYTKAGGNGAAMRIQPHAWIKRSQDEMILAVLRDAIITHGHTHGFAGAVLHAICVRFAMEGDLLSPFELDPIFRAIHSIPAAVEKDRQLAAFWKPAWESASGQTLEAAVDDVLGQLSENIHIIEPFFARPKDQAYESMLGALELKTDKYRGSGLRTSLAAMSLAWLCRDDEIEHSLRLACNSLGSDTDTIATMAGAILGAYRPTDCDWPIQDREYLTQEARRLASISSDPKDSFTYPDLADWQAPSTQSDSVVVIDNRLAIVGLGYAEPSGEEYAAGDAIWQWMTLPFGQTVLAKRRVSPPSAKQDQLPRERRSSIRTVSASPTGQNQGELGFEMQPDQNTIEQQVRASKTSRPSPSIDDLTEQVIRSDFDPYLTGSALNWIIEHDGRIESAVAFASIIAKARLARMRKRGR